MGSNSNNEIYFVDATVRDGNQSLWDATGIKTGMVLSIASEMDRAGFRAIDFTSSINMGTLVRFHKENPWEMIRLCARAMPNTILSFGTTGRRFIGFRPMPNSIQELVIKTIKGCGIRRLWILDVAYGRDNLFRTARIAKEAGIEEVMNILTFSVSPVHTDEFYAQKARQTAECPDVDIVCLEDQGGLLTPDRVRTLIPAIQKNIGSLPLEAHFHCNTGLAPLCYLEAMKLGVKTFHVTVPPLSYGSSLPSALNIMHNAIHMGYKVKVNKDALEAMSAHFRMVAAREGRPEGQMEEYDAYYYKHQIPGGMLSTLKRHLAEVRMEHRLDEVIEEVVRVRQELGYPIMATPFSQFVGTQATMNVVSGQRYSVVSDNVLQYVAGWFGELNAPVDPDVLDKITSLPRAKEFFNKELEQPTVEEIRRQMGIGPEVSDEEFLLRYSMTDREVDEMLSAGPIKTTYP